MPEGIAPADPSATIDVFQADDEGKPISVKIAEATYEDGVLTVTFVAPVDTETGAARELSSLRASIDLDVLLSTALAGDTATQIEWTLQVAADGSAQTARLAIPARSAFEIVLEQPQLSQDEEVAEQELAATDAAMGVLNALTLPGTRAAEGTWTYTWDARSGSAEMRITWCDNNSSARPDRDTYASHVLPQFQIDGGEWITLVTADGRLTEAARQALNIPENETPSWVKQAAASTASTGTWNLSVSGMPTELNTTVTVPALEEDGSQKYDERGNPLTVVVQLDEHGDPLYEENDQGVMMPVPTENGAPSKSQKISWRLIDTNDLPAGYTYGENDGGETGLEGSQEGSDTPQRYLMLTQEFTFTIQGKLGDKMLKEVFGGGLDASAYADYFRFSALIDNKQVTDDTGAVRFNTLAGMAGAQYAEGQSFTIVFSEDGNTATITATLPRYDESGAPIVYYAYFEDPNAPAGDAPATDADYFQPTYDNAASPSHGSATDALYDNGTMTIRPVGTASYGATKVWLDGGNRDNRPETTFTLWRYSTNGSPATASQVQLNEVDGTASGAQENAVDYVQITIPAGSADTIDLGQLLAEQYGEQGKNLLENLPKYDPDGYPYIYALREDTSLAGYETVYGSVAADGAVTDTQPNYVDETGATQKLDQPDRSGDHFIYNGGTVTNRLTGTVEVKATKTWEIAAFQDSLDDVVVTFMAQSRLKGSNDAWNDTGKTLDVDGWKAEVLTQTFSGTFPKYDSQGRELEYRWVECDVALGDQDTAFEADGAGGGTFTLTLENEEGQDEQLAFTSTLDEETNTITNTFANTTEEHVDKFWQQPDGSMAQIKPQDGAYDVDHDLDTSGVAYVQLFQSGTLIGTFELDGVTDAAPTPIDGLEGATYQETASYHLDFEGLPKYDDGGVRYSYIVLETDVATGWYTDRQYDDETHTTQIYNRIGQGETSEIRIVKQWNDGDDSQHRLKVAVNLVALHHIESKAKNDDGTPRYSYEAGKAVNAQPIILSGNEAWYAEYAVPIGNLTYKDFKVVELYLIDEDANGNEVHYPVVDSAEAKAAYEGLSDDLDWINEGWDYETSRGTERVATDDHVYEVSATEDAAPTYNDDMRAVTATNRRLGLLDLTVEKTWNDQGEHTRPDAELTLSSTEYPDAFSADAEGRIWVQVSANKLPVLDDAGNQLTTGEHVRVEDGSVIVTVDTANDAYTSTYHFFGLPKYDEEGDVVHYDVNEEWVDGHGDYSYTKRVGAYTVGSRHFHDTQTIEFTNTRQATREVTFNKLWQDHYVNDSLRQRPDIYLTLYRVTVGVDGEGALTYSEPEQVNGYVHYLWTGTPDADDPQYAQSCTISGLPAYDENGSQYIYYASESMSADGGSLDYAPVRFDYTGVVSVQAGSTEPNAVVVDARYEGANPEENGTGWAIHEGGRFVNALTDNLVARGTKLWEDVPSNTSQGTAGTMLTETDLPEVTVYLQQRVQGEAWPSLKFDVTEGEDGTAAWSFADGTSAIAWTSDLSQVTTNQYSYMLTHTGSNTAESAAAAIAAENPTLPEGAELLPRYTEDGKIYEYRAIEVVWGMLDEPGGISTEWVKSTDFSALRDGDEDAMGVYVIEHGETGSFFINNIYQSKTGKLTVQKHYTGREAGDRYPDTTFDVYRYFVRADGSKSDAALVDSVTITNDMLKAKEPTKLDGLTVENAGEASTTASYTFDGLDIYAPDGSYWQYYVVEHSIKGYTTTVAVGDVAAGNVTGAGEAAAGGVSSGALCPADTSDSVESTVLGDNTTPDVTFENAYTPGQASLTGTKTWSDFDDIFNLRPTADEFKAGLTVERIGNGKVEKLGEDGGLGLLQSSEPDDPYYFTVAPDPSNQNNYIITLANVAKFAPDGTSYQYRITENLSGMVLGQDDETADDYYSAANTSSTVSAENPGNGFRFTNSLKGQASVVKTWNDGDDPYGLRPTTVTVRLQARYTYSGGTTSAWADFKATLTSLGYWDAFAEECGGEEAAVAYLEKTLSAENGWRGSWTELPTAGREAAGTNQEGRLFTLEYRVVEVQIGNQKIDQPTNDGVNFEYTTSEGGEYHPYQPAQDSWTSELGKSSTAISNTLETTSISATKSWTGDTVDGVSDAWDTRGGDEWAVTYLLQRRLEGSGDDGWQWLMEYGEDLATSPLDDGIVSQVITGTGDSATATWENLPDCDADGTKYEYRVVERVPGGYDVEGGTEIAEATDATTGVTYRFYAVASTDADADGQVDSQAFTNDLRLTSLTGTKTWDDYDTTLADDLTEDDMPDLVLYRAIQAGEDATGHPIYSTAEPVRVKRADGTTAVPQPTWKETGDSTWTFTYEDLPAANEDNVDYVYWAVEENGAAPGYYPHYGTAPDQSDAPAGASGTTVTTPATAGTDGAQQNEAITNVATRFTLDKVSDFTPAGESAPENLRDIELTVYGSDGQIYAVWKDVGGTVSSTVWPTGTRDATTGGVEMTGTDAGYIVGLRAGTYTVRETGTVPAGYAKAPDTTVIIAKDGTIAATQSGNENVLEVTGGNPGGTITVNVEDPVLRANLSFTKYVTDDGQVGGAHQAPLQNAKFDLYVEGIDEPIARGLTSDAQGTVATNSSANKGIALSDAFVTEHDGKYWTLADGLPEGTYHFEETDATTGAVLPTGDAAKSPELEITQADHGTTVSTAVGGGAAQMANEDFSAVVKLHKYDTATGDPIEGAVFDITYTPAEGSASTQATSWQETTGPDGVLTIDGPGNAGLEKGTYVVAEASNTGYVSNDFRAQFTIDDADDNMTYDITTTDPDDPAVEAIDFEVTSGEDTFTDDKGIPNVPERGSVTMAKVSSAGAAPIDGATFELQRKAEDGTWETLASDLTTGRDYTMNDANDALVDAEGTAGTSGQITVRNLTWGTYQFVETAPAPGYAGANEDGAITSAELEIKRDDLNPSLTGGTAVPNEPTRLELEKANDIGQPLQGAEFQVTAVGATEFADPEALTQQYGDTYDAAKKTVTLTTDSTGHAALEAQLMVGGTYTVFESKAPSGYDPADSVLTVVVQQDGSLEVQGAMPDRYAWADLDEDGHADNAWTFMVTNLHEEIDLRKVSADKTDLPIAGAEFTLIGQCMTDNNTTHTYTTNDDGYIHIDAGLMGGVVYRLYESKPGAGYIARPDTLFFMMDERGEIVVTDSAGTPLAEEDYPAGYAVGADGISFEVTDESVDLQITKRAPGEDGELGEPLFGAEFSVTPAEGSAFADGRADAQVLRTGEDGALRMGAQLVVGGVYDITEVSAPEGYERVTGTMRVTVAADGEIMVLGSVNEDDELIPGSAAPTGYEKVADNAFEVQVTNEPIEVGIVKVGEDDVATGLAGAQFELTGVFPGTGWMADRTETRTLTTGEDGRIDLAAELVAGETYTLRETVAPDGYKLLEGQIEFTVAEDGTITLVGDAPEGMSIQGDSVTILAIDEPIGVSFAKTDEAGEALTGATFSIARTDGSALPDGSASREFTSDETGLVFEDLQLAGSAEGIEYTVTELAAPAGYEVAPAFTILVFEDGHVEPGAVPEAIAGAVSVENEAASTGAGADGDATADAGEDGQVPATSNSAVVTLADARIEAQIAKVSTDGRALSGAEFAVTGRFADGSGTKAVAVDERGRAELEGLVAGETYRVRETVAPEGYDLIEGTWEFTVQADGTLAGEATSTGPDTAGYAVAEDGVTLRAVDAPTPAIPGELPGTGDTKLTYAVVLGIAALACLAGGLRLSRRKR